MTMTFTGVDLVCPRCGRRVDPADKPVASMRGTTLAYAHRACPVTSNAGARLVIQGSKGRAA
jgi:hypothetical protein